MSKTTLEILHLFNLIVCYNDSNNKRLDSQNGKCFNMPYFLTMNNEDLIYNYIMLRGSHGENIDHYDNVNHKNNRVNKLQKNKNSLNKTMLFSAMKYFC